MIPKKRSNWSSLVPPVLCIGCASMAHGQSLQAGPASAITELPTVVVSASRHEQAPDSLPVSMDVINARQMQDGQIGDIRDAAKELPNVSVRHAPARFTVTGAGNPTGRDSNAGFNVRGLDGNRVLMLVDGIRLPRSYINGNNAFGRDSISLDLLKRIELVRGPSSVLYGSDGLAGLVNFITLMPADFLTGANGEARSSGGRLGLAWHGDDQGASVNGTYAGRYSERVQWLLSASLRHSSGLDNMGSNGAANVDRTRPNPQSNGSGSLLGKLVFRPGEAQRHVFSFEHIERVSSFDLLSSRSKTPLTAASVVDEKAHQQLRRDRFTWEARYRLDSAWADQLQTMISRQESSSLDDGRTQRFDGGVRLRDTRYAERGWQAGVQASKSFALSGSWTQRLTYGFDFTQIDVTSWFGGSDSAPLPTYVPKKYFPDTRDRSTALYLQDEIGNEHLTITPGLRFERFAMTVLRQDGFAPPSPTPGVSLSGSNVSPKLGAVLRLNPQWSVYGNYAAGFRAPNAAQVNGFVENPTPTTYVTLLPNPNLKPETSVNLELGARLRSDRLTLNMAAFAGNFRQLIIDKMPLGGAGVAGNPLIFQTVNIDAARIQGVEVNGKWVLGSAFGGQWNLPFALGRTSGRNRDTGLPINTIEPLKALVGLHYEGAALSGRLQAIHHAAKAAGDLDSPYLAKPATPPRVAQFLSDAATTIDAHLQWRLRKDLRLNLMVGNLTNRKYWLWSNVQGLAANSTVLDAYTQPGRYGSVSLILDF